jgi:hypothetical protein
LLPFSVGRFSSPVPLSTVPLVVALLLLLLLLQV